MELMQVEVLAPNSSTRKVFQVSHYTVHADGRLDLVLADGSVVALESDDWMDIGVAGSFSPGRAK